MFDFMNLPDLCRRTVIDYLDLKSFLSLMEVSKDARNICISTLQTRTVEVKEILLEQNSLGQWTVLSKKTDALLPITERSLRFGQISTSVLDISFSAQSAETRSDDSQQKIGCFHVSRKSSPKKEKTTPLYCPTPSWGMDSFLKEILCFLERVKCKTLWLRTPEESEQLTQSLREVIQLLQPDFIFGQYVGLLFPLNHKLTGITGIFKTDAEFLACNVPKITAYKATDSLTFSAVNQLVLDWKRGQNELVKLQISWELQSPNALDHLPNLLAGLGAERIEMGRTAYRIKGNAGNTMVFAINSHSVKLKREEN